MFDTYLTISGNVADTPRSRNTRSGHAVTTFRVASTSRRFDADQGRFVDNSTLWVSVTCWRQLAENVAACVRKGQPVVVTGRYNCHEYMVDETKRLSYELEATAVGHDLSRGTADFTKTVRPGAPLSVPAADEGGPVDVTDQWLDAEITDGELEALTATLGAETVGAGAATSG